MITFKVPSEMYGVTDCVITDIQRTLKTGYAPCGSGEDYKLTIHDIEQLKLINRGVPIEFNHNIVLYHGTNKTAMKNIIKVGFFRPYAWFSNYEKTARRYALMSCKRESSAVVMRVVVNPDSLYYTGDYWMAKGKLKLIDGVYQ